MNTSTTSSSINTNSRSSTNSRRHVEVLANYLKHCSETRSMCLHMFNLLNQQENNMRIALNSVIQPDFLTDSYNNSNTNFNTFANNNRYSYSQSPRNNNNNHNNNEFDINNLFGIIFREIQRTTNTSSNERRRVPTQDEIRNATTETSFSNLTNPINTTCPISGETFESETVVLKINHCGHIFEKQLLLSWFVRNSRCPLCRYSILSSNNNSRTNENSEINNNNNNLNNNNSSRGNESHPNFQIESIVIEPVYETTMTSNNLQTQNNNNTTSNISRNILESNSSNNSNHINYHTLFESNLNPLQLLQNILASPGVTHTSYQLYANNNNEPNRPNTLNFDLSSNILD